MGALEVGQKMVALVNEGREGEAAFVRDYYAKNIVSIEGQGSEAVPARIEGIDAVHGKHDWWYANNTVHGTSAEGPFVGHRDDQFAVRFTMDITPEGGERSRMTEVALYTVKNDKIVQEEYLYLMG